MADIRKARLLSSVKEGGEARLLRFSSASTTQDGFAFTGGQYIILNTGIPLPDGKVAKRAYSLLSSDADPGTFEIAVRRVGSGPGSNYLLDLQPGSEIQFSGPWGKYLPLPATDDDPQPPTLIVATDTGITAALGLLSGQSFAPQRQHTRLVWLRDSDDYFLPESVVRERLGNGLSPEAFEVHDVPFDSDARVTWLQQNAERIVPDTALRAAYLSGDGFLLAAFRDRLNALPSAPKLFIESFFHHQLLKDPAKGAASS